MTYLYAGLGVAMLAGIMAIFEMGLSLTGQSLINDRTDAYLVSDQAKWLDQKISLILATTEVKDSGLEGSELCVRIRESSLWNQGESKPINRSVAGAEHPCVLVLTTHLDGRDGVQPTLQQQGYRQKVVVFRDGSNPQNPYRLFSCVMSNESPLPLLSFCEEGED